MSKFEVTSGAKIVRTKLAADGSVVQTEKSLSPSEVRQMDGAIEQVIDNVRSGRPERSPVAVVDPRDVRQHQLDVLKGRQADKDGWWKKVMEYYGFNWIEASQLDATIGPQRVIPPTLTDVSDRYGREIYNNRLYWTRSHQEGQWRPDVGKKRPHPALSQCSFTMVDLIDMFGEPEKFDEWAKQRILAFERHRKHIRVLRR